MSHKIACFELLWAEVSISEPKIWLCSWTRLWRPTNPQNFKANNHNNNLQLTSGSDSCNRWNSNATKPSSSASLLLRVARLCGHLRAKDIVGVAVVVVVVGRLLRNNQLNSTGKFDSSDPLLCCKSCLLAAVSLSRLEIRDLRLANNKQRAQFQLPSKLYFSRVPILLALTWDPRTRFFWLASMIFSVCIPL